MTHRLYLPPASTGTGDAGARQGDQIQLNPEQSHYLVRVLRSKVGDEILCFDGTGFEHHATVTSSDGRACVLHIGAMSREQPAPRYELALACAWLKGSAMDTVVQKATELGATSVHPLVTDRSNVKLDERRRDNKLRHWRQISISAAEQCGRLHLPVVHAPESLSMLLGNRIPAACILLDPGAPTLDVGTTPRSLTLLVGPEGGWTDAERQLASRAGATAASLGSTVLRAETAPLAALAAVRQSWRWQP